MKENEYRVLIARSCAVCGPCQSVVVFADTAQEAVDSVLADRPGACVLCVFCLCTDWYPPV